MMMMRLLRPAQDKSLRDAVSLCVSSSLRDSSYNSQPFCYRAFCISLLQVGSPEECPFPPVRLHTLQQ